MSLDNYEKTVIKISKSTIYVDIRESLEKENKPFFKELLKNKKLKSFIEKKTEYIYSQLLLFITNGMNEAEAYIYLKNEVIYEQ